MVNVPVPTAAGRWPLVTLLVLGACGQLESEEAREVAQATRKTVSRGVDSAKEQLDKVDTQKIRAAWDKTVTAVEDSAKRDPASSSGPTPDPLADAAQAIACDEARERCTVTAEFASRARAHGGRVAAQVSVSPASGDVRGIRIDAIDAGTIAELVGLRSGDVVTHVNGTPLGSPQDAMLLYMSVRSARSFVVHYQRGREARSLQVDVV